MNVSDSGYRIKSAWAYERLHVPAVFQQWTTRLLDAVHVRAGQRFPSVQTKVEADLRGWLPVIGVVLEETLIQQILHEAESALRGYVTAQGQVDFDIQGHIVTGTRV